MKTTLKQVVDSYHAVGELLRMPKCPPVAKFRALALYKACKAEVEHFQEANNGLVKEMSEDFKNEQGQVAVKPENIPEFFKRREALLNEEVEVAVKPIELPAECELTAIAFAVLEPFGVTMLPPVEPKEEPKPEAKPENIVPFNRPVK